jgi:hypothetical protein
VNAVAVLDQVTEEISHFIGSFHLSLEEARQREAYNDFTFRPAHPNVVPLNIDPRDFSAPFDLIDYDPSLNYRGTSPTFPGPSPFPLPQHVLPKVQPQFRSSDDGEELSRSVQGSSTSHAASATYVIDPPGSVATFAFQNIALSDNDTFSVGGHDLTIVAVPYDGQELLAAAAPVLSLSPLDGLVEPTSADEMIEIVHKTAELLDGVADSEMAPFVAGQSNALVGNFVNGSLVEEVPKYTDYRPPNDAEEEAEEGPSHLSLRTSGMPGDTSVEITAGDNTLVNTAVVQSAWTSGKVMAVLGDHTEVNAISQINAIWNHDSIPSGVASLGSSAVDADSLFNIATFGREGVETPHASSGSDFPHYWAVTEISGDLMIVNWIEQLIFMGDNDIGIASASGHYSSVVSGDNTAINHTAITQIGLGYDLIIIGGSVFDANIVQQTNILFDNDHLVTAGGFQTSGTVSFSSAGNLLWNQAAIHNVGAADRFGDLPSAYVDAAHSIEDGYPSFSSDILHDPAFAGLSGLRVLYIHGDLIDLQYIKQTSILGDNDQIALAIDAVAPQVNGTWTVGTGGNTLVNNAGIFDLDSLGKTYVGGEQYSQETLIQANFISSQPELHSQDPSLLASEAVLFLDDSMLDQHPEPVLGVHVTPDHTAGHGDGLQAMLG